MNFELGTLAMGVLPDHSPKPPFTDIVDPDVFYRSPIHQTVCAELFAATRTHGGLLVLSGEPGTGKTTVLRRLARDLEEAGGRVLWCDEILSLHAMFRPVNGGPGGLVGATPAETLLAAVQARVHSDRATVVAVDEAQRLEPVELGILRDLAEAGRAAARPVTVLLVGLPGLDAKFTSLVGDGANGASEFCVRLSRLETPEVRAYMAYRLAHAGLRLDQVFQADAVERVAAYAEGIPRLINYLCSGALHCARLAGLTMVSASAVDAAARWLDLSQPVVAPMARGWREASRGVWLWTGRRVAAGHRMIRAWAPGIAALGLAGVSASRGVWLWTGRQVAAGHRTIRAWAPGIAALGLGAIAVFIAFRPTSPPPSQPPQPAPLGQNRPSQPPPPGSAAGAPMPPPKTEPVIERPPPSSMPVRAERPSNTRPVPQRSAPAGSGRTTMTARVIVEEPTTPPAGRGPSAAVALVQSAEAGNLIEVRDIIDAGVSPNARDTGGMTPLMMAVIHNHDAIVELLLRKGADVNARDASGVTPLMLAASKGRAVSLSRLLARGAHINAQSQRGWTALTYAAWEGHPSLVRRLLESGADPAHVDRTGSTALQHATRRLADPAVRSAGNDPALARLAHLRYGEVIDLLRKASGRRQLPQAGEKPEVEPAPRGMTQSAVRAARGAADAVSGSKGGR
jgi:type II secretory pathway predicted ATPase ExeA